MIDHFLCNNCKSVSQDEDLSPGPKKNTKIQKPCFTAARKKIVDYRICIVFLV